MLLQLYYFSETVQPHFHRCTIIRCGVCIKKRDNLISPSHLESKIYRYVYTIGPYFTYSNKTSSLPFIEVTYSAIFLMQLLYKQWHEIVVDLISLNISRLFPAVKKGHFLLSRWAHHEPSVWLFLQLCSNATEKPMDINRARYFIWPYSCLPK